MKHTVTKTSLRRKEEKNKVCISERYQRSRFEICVDRFAFLCICSYVKHFEAACVLGSIHKYLGDYRNSRPAIQRRYHQRTVRPIRKKQGQTGRQRRHSSKQDLQGKCRTGLALLPC
ncbi:hypothetical protein POVWA1_001080 [Plasmodium ovale wallikeri]|uniref:Uncharacterized protein n=1 Tax=Plasmodium ovale wallikeri TaxID=864142 RepID=A0A1A8YFX3_PLAOA|nr:hypothetical protein POVWA1_001080 [Plasmodium ovale wallikeri]